MIAAELDQIVIETGSVGATPEMTLSRVLQQLRKVDAIEFLGRGAYRLRDPSPLLAPSKGVFVVGAQADHEDRSAMFHRIAAAWVEVVTRTAGNWVILQSRWGERQACYHAVTKVEKIIPEPGGHGRFLALFEPGSYLEFGRDVPLQVGGQAVDRGLPGPDGRHHKGRATQPVRLIANEDFNRIIGLGLIGADELLPRVDEDEFLSGWAPEEQEAGLDMVDRATVLVSRTVRDRQFRKRVLDVYDRRCALTGMRLINGGGRAEAQAAHIMSVEAGGPDKVTNGIALSGTAHWMFDRGLISLSDAGGILLSPKINDIDSVQRLIHPDRRARLPTLDTLRPHPAYLAWHREHHRFAP